LAFPSEKFLSSRSSDEKKSIIFPILYTHMSTSLFVGGISYNTTEDALRQAFEQAGVVTSAKIVLDRETGRSRGFAFVDMETDEGAEAAITLWNGKELDGRKIAVNAARPRPPRRNFDRPGGGGGRGFGGDDE
jgi:cold-inducible RNA-binding protein